MLKMDYSLLRGKIRTYFGSETNFVKELQNSGIEISTGSFSNKINNRSPFNQIEILGICNLLKIDLKENSLYFFIEKYELNS